jgi:hypothetical protein
MTACSVFPVLYIDMLCLSCLYNYLSFILGHHQWLMVTQAHTFKVSQFGGTDEGGQLMLLTAPGSAD